MMNVSPGQLATAGSYITREWGDYGYSIEDIESPTHAVTLFYVKVLDGSRFAVAVDKWGNTGGPVDSRGYYMPESPEDAALAALVAEMHHKATGRSLT